MCGIECLPAMMEFDVADEEVVVVGAGMGGAIAEARVAMGATDGAADATVDRTEALTRPDDCKVEVDLLPFLAGILCPPGGGDREL
mmetsp:Transcript_52495/g.111875  ORF Transcript_52495/g.111875 Transcript_52495/m.111875 type:complete len:86 (-) Transcript_52495:43-300(-)